MKRLCLLTIFLSLALINISAPRIFATDNETPVSIIKKGTFLKAMAQRDISTSTADIGDEVTFINLLDMYVVETNAIPQNSILYGTIEDLKEPVQGTNAAIKIKITKIITPTKKVIPVNAYIYSENDNYIGGELTSSMYYNRIPHYTEGWGGGVLQYAPMNIRNPGKDTIIKPGAELFVIFMDDLKIN